MQCMHDRKTANFLRLILAVGVDSRFHKVYFDAVTRALGMSNNFWGATPRRFGDARTLKTADKSSLSPPVPSGVFPRVS